MKETLMQEFNYHAGLLAAYQPSPSNHNSTRGLLKMVILRSQGTLDVEKFCGVRYDWLSSNRQREKAIRGWKRIAECDVIEVLPIPGDHFEAFTPENASQAKRTCTI